MTRIELLAPAKDKECGIAAINYGADAVYIGATRFGAREAAGNDLADIEALVQHAHRYWARVYVTLNTLLHDDELPPAVRLVAQLHEIGVDGLIIQDVGLLECDLPPIPLIASTQMHNHTPEKVAFLEQVGITRAILARELSLEDIRAIRGQTSSIELECFIHGALCVCYSGQCYLSYALGGRSGNRGQCAQPCRKPYSLLDGAGREVVANRHLLSLRDLRLSDHLGDLLDAGVCSFKIEGRLKDQAYIMNVVSHYRAQLDAALAARDLQKSSSGTSVIDFTPDPDKTFNRSYSTYFLRGRGASIASPDTPKMVGEPIGTVTAVDRRTFAVDSAIPLHNGDGVCFFDAEGELRGTAVNGVAGQTITPEKMAGIVRGTYIYRNHDHEFLTRLAKSRPERRIAVACALREMADGFSLSVVDEDGNAAVFTQPCEKVLAQQPERAVENIEKQVRKTGGTEFACSEVRIELAQPYFLPVSVLNALRRGALEQLAQVRAANRPRLPGGKVIRNTVAYPQRRLTFEANVLNRQAEAFYRRHGALVVERAAESGLDLRGRRVMTTRYCLKHQLGLCAKHGGTTTATGPFTLVDDEGRRLPLRFDCAACVMEVYMTDGD